MSRDAITGCVRGGGPEAFLAWLLIVAVCLLLGAVGGFVAGAVLERVSWDLTIGGSTYVALGARWGTIAGTLFALLREVGAAPALPVARCARILAIAACLSVAPALLFALAQLAAVPSEGAGEWRLPNPRRHLTYLMIDAGVRSFPACWVFLGGLGLLLARRGTGHPESDARN